MAAQTDGDSANDTTIDGRGRRNEKKAVEPGKPEEVEENREENMEDTNEGNEI